MQSAKQLESRLEELATTLDLAMPATRQVLETIGLSSVQDNLGLRWDVHRMGVHVGIALFIPEELVSELVRATQYPDTAFRHLFDKLFGTLHFGGAPRKELFLYVITDGTPFVDKLTAKEVYSIESSMDYALKLVCSNEELGLLLANPFPVLTGAARANEAPALSLLKTQHDRAEGDGLPTRNLYIFNGTGEAYAKELALVPGNPQAERVKLLYARIMGRGFKLIISATSVRFAQTYQDIGSALDYASRGERAGFELACFLAKASAEVHPGMRIGLNHILANLDIMKLLAALDVLRQFMEATGSSIEVESANSSVQNMTKTKFKFLEPAKAPVPSMA